MDLFQSKDLKQRSECRSSDSMFVFYYCLSVIEGHPRTEVELVAGCNYGIHDSTIESFFKVFWQEFTGL